MTYFRQAVLAIALAGIPMSVVADELDEARIKELVYEAIRENPEIVMEAVSILQRRDEAAQAAAAQAILRDQGLLERDPNAPVLGNLEGDVTVVEFFDYNCPYCKRAMPEVQALLAADTGVRLVYREWPILGEGSVYASRAALAARAQGKYEDFHWALMGSRGRVTEPLVLRIAEEVGLDIEQLKQDMEAPEVEEHIASSKRMAQILGISGTPSFVIGDALVPGLIKAARLEELVREARNTE